MKLVKVCAETEERKAELAKQMAGAWVCDGVLGTMLGNNANSVNLATLISILYGARCSEFNDHQHWRQCDVLIDKNSMWRPNFVGWSVRTALLSTNALPVGKTAIDARLAIRRGRTTELTTVPVLNLGVERLDDVSRSALAWLLMRREFRVYTPQLVRTLRSSYMRGFLKLDAMIEVASGFGDKFALAALKLAKRGFKSKRFKPVALKVGDKVRRYYDRWSVVEVQNMKLAGKIQGTVSRVYPTQVELNTGDIFNYSLATGFFEVIGA